MKVGIATMPRSVRAAVDIARVADDLGFDVFGIGEGPFLNHDAYVTVTACLLATERVPTGPFVTNPVVRNWTVHASTAAASRARARPLLPRRRHRRRREPIRGTRADAVVGGRGCGRVHSRARAGFDARPLHGFGTEGRGQRGFLRRLCRRRDRRRRHRDPRARRSDGRAGDAEVWTMIPALVVDGDDAVAAARNAMRLAVYSTADFAFAGTFASKHVPDEYQPILRECFAGYDYAFHGVAGDVNPNLRAFDDHPEVGDYLLDRMVLVGTARTFREQVERLRDKAALDGITFPVQSPDHAGRIAAALEGLGSLER